MASCFRPSNPNLRICPVKNRITKLLRWLNVLLILTTFLAYLAPFVDPESFWFLSFFGLGYPWLLLANLLFVLFWAVLKKRYFLYSLGCILLRWTHFTGFVGLHSADRSSEPTLKVMTLNTFQMKRFYGKDPSYRNPDSQYSITELYDFVRDERVDVLCMQEFFIWDAAAEAFHLEIKEEAGLKYVHRSERGNLVIFSRFPFKDKQALTLGDQSNGSIQSDLDVNGQTVRLITMHLKSNSVSGLADKVV